MKRYHQLDCSYAYFGMVMLFNRAWHFYWNGKKAHYRAKHA